MNKKVPTKQEIGEICKAYLKEYWNEELIIPVKIDGRLKSCLGYFSHIGTYPGVKSSMVQIKFSKNLFLYYNEHSIKGVILHELCHYVLYKKGIKDFYDGGRTFEKELKRIGSHSSRTLNRQGILYTVYCSVCNKKYYKTFSKRKATNMVNKNVCTCNRKLLIETKLYIQKEEENLNYCNNK